MLQPQFPYFLTQRITLHDSMDLALKKILCDQFSQLIQLEAGVKSGKEIEDLHQMRTAVRRLRVGLQSGKDIFGKETTLVHRTYLKSFNRLLGGVRDLDTFLVFLESGLLDVPLEQLSELPKLIARLRQERERKSALITAELDSSKYQQWKEDFLAFLLQEHPVKYPAKIVKTEAPVCLRLQLDQVLRRRKKVFTASLEELHRLRIRIKVLRYRSEFFRKIYDKRLKEIIADLVQMQDTLGIVLDKQRDMDLLRNLAEKPGASLPYPHNSNFLTVITQRLHEEKATAHEQFMTQWRNFSLKENCYRIQYILLNL